MADSEYPADGGAAPIAADAGLIIGHGSRHLPAVAEFQTLCEGVRGCLPDLRVAGAFLELAEPGIPAALDRLAADGARSIAIAPALLFAADHMKTDVPAILRQWQAGHPHVSLSLARPLGVSPGMVTAAGDRVAQALDDVGPADRAETLLLMIGRGSSDPDANADAAKLSRLLWEGLGLGWAMIAYTDVTFPHVVPALGRAARLGYRRIVVLPYLLFTGVLMARIDGWVAAAQAANPEIEYRLAPYLGDHPAVAATVAQRLTEATRGDTAMNCQLCQYRLPILGFDRNVGAPQVEDRTKPGHPFADHPLGARAFRQRGANDAVD